MATFRKIHVVFWSDPFIQSLSPERKYFYLYLLTNEKTRQCGIYEISEKTISQDTGYNTDTVSILLKYFIDTKKIAYSKSTSEIAIKNWKKYNDNTSPKVQTLVKQELIKVKDKKLIEYINSTDTVSIHNPQKEREEEEEIKKEGEKEIEESFKKKFLIVEMKEIFLIENKNYTAGEKDFEALRDFAKTIAQNLGIKDALDFWNEEQKIKVKEKWRSWAKIISSSPLFCNKSLEELNRFKKVEISNISKNGSNKRHPGEKPIPTIQPEGGFGQL